MAGVIIMSDVVDSKEDYDFYGEDMRDEVQLLFKNIKLNSSQLMEVFEDVSEESNGYVYRYYHHSSKVYGLQLLTLRILEILEKILPDRELNNEFKEIIAAGTENIFDVKDNKNWSIMVRPILEAFFHARYFLEMAIYYGKELRWPPGTYFPAGWAGLLYLYNLR